MLSTIVKFITENKSLLTTVIAIAGFVLSLFQFIHSLWSKRTNISVSLETLCTLNAENEQSIKLGLIFQNNSSSPIIITRVSLLLNHRASYSCVSEPIDGLLNVIIQSTTKQIFPSLKEYSVQIFRSLCNHHKEYLKLSCLTFLLILN